ncbi:hypothetical protein ACQKP0_16260 [Heyndrickxia sp. NPDC080065]|uniref:hypothetical protein n=1 Tax=Heyndrickxia sp. NPDC080065 TaxID=3390568 RepID=UPI003CFF9A3A
MDKHAKNQIRIKINGEERPFKEKMEIHDWKSGKEETAAGAENASEEDQFDWVLPEIEENQVNEFKKIHYSKTNYTPSSTKLIKRKTNRPFSMLLFSIITAITIGVLIGFFMLKIVIYQSNTAQKASTTGTNTSSVNNSGKTSIIRLPALTTALVQGGVYENPQPIVNDIKGKGIPAIVLPIENKNYIYIGVAGEIGTAKALASKYEEQGVSVYTKELTFNDKSISISTKDEETFITISIPLFQTLAEEIANSYVSGKMNKDSIAEIKTKIEQIANFKGIKNKQIETLRKNQVASYQSLLSYQSNQDNQELMKAQDALLTYLQEINRLK